MKTMKSFRPAKFLAGAAACLLICSMVHADNPARTSKPKKPARSTTAKASQPPIQMETLVVTGSLLPTQGRRRAITTSPVTVIDSRTIRSSGAGDLASLLNKRVTSR